MKDIIYVPNCLDEKVYNHLLESNKEYRGVCRQHPLFISMANSIAYCFLIKGDPERFAGILDKKGVSYSMHDSDSTIFDAMALKIWRQKQDKKKGGLLQKILNYRKN